MKDRKVQTDPLALLRESLDKKRARNMLKIDVEVKTHRYGDGTEVKQVETMSVPQDIHVHTIDGSSGVFSSVDIELDDILHETEKEAGIARMHKVGKRFMAAAEAGSASGLSRFIDAGFPVNYQAPVTGHTALHLTAAYNAHSALRLLLGTGECDFLLRDNEGRLASEMAYVFGRDPAVARLLGIKERKQGEAQGVKVTRRSLPA